MAELRKYGAEATIYFPLVDAGAVDFEATPVSFAAGDTQVSKDGGHLLTAPTTRPMRATVFTRWC
jgi:hypothetical protein